MYLLFSEQEEIILSYGRVLVRGTISDLWQVKPVRLRAFRHHSMLPLDYCRRNSPKTNEIQQ